jgi:hypothetical protein
MTGDRRLLEYSCPLCRKESNVLLPLLAAGMNIEKNQNDENDKHTFD